MAYENGLANLSSYLAWLNGTVSYNVKASMKAINESGVMKYWQRRHSWRSQQYGG